MYAKDGKQNMKDEKKLRIHHLLCIPLFKGAGYSGAFCENMTEVIQKLKADRKQPLTAVTGPDVICEGCPNRMENGGCKNSAKGTGVSKKDARLAENMQIEEGNVYSFFELLKMAKERMTKEIFEASCKNCEWYGKGLCSFELWEENVKKFLTDSFL